MRTTFTLDDDVAAEVERLRRQEGIGISAAVNQLIRTGLARRPADKLYRHTAREVGLRGDMSNIAAVLELLDDEQ